MISPFNAPLIRSCLGPGPSIGTLLLDLMLDGGLQWGKPVGVRGSAHASLRALPWSIAREARRLGRPCAVVSVRHAGDERHSTDDALAEQTVCVDASDPGGVLRVARALVTYDLQLLVIDGMPAPAFRRDVIPEREATALVRALEDHGVACLYTIREPRRLPRVLAAPGVRHLTRRTPTVIELSRCSMWHRRREGESVHVHARVTEAGLDGAPLTATLELDVDGRLAGGRLSPATLVELGIRRKILTGEECGPLFFETEQLGRTARAAALRLSDDTRLADAVQQRIVARARVPF